MCLLNVLRSQIYVVRNIQLKCEISNVGAKNQPLLWFGVDIYFLGPSCIQQKTLYTNQLIY
jgi:hypothetical protein